MESELHKNSQQINSDSFDYSMPPTDIGVISSDLVPNLPQAGWKENADHPITFHILPTPGYFTRLDLSLLYKRIKVKTEDKADLDSTNEIAPCASFFGSYFENVTFLFNNTPLTRNQGNLYPYQHYFENLLGFSKPAQDSYLTSELFYPDSTDKFDSLNANYQKRKKKIESSKSLEVCGVLKSALQSQHRAIPDNVTITIILRRSKPEFCLTGAKGTNYMIELEDIVFYTKRLQLHPKLLKNVHALLHSKKRLNYLIRDRTVDSFQMPTGTINHPQLIFNGATPNMLVLGFVKAEAMLGAYDKSPFAFEKHGVSSVSLSIEGDSTKIWRTYNFEGGLNLMPFQYLQSVIPHASILGHGLDRDDFVDKQCFLICIDLKSQATQQFQIKGNTQTKLVIRFAAATTYPINCVVFSEFPALVQLGSDGSFYSDALVI